MKISDNTLNLLKNFSNINKGISIKAGSVISTIGPAKNIFAIAEVPEKFPTNFAIYELPKFIGAISLFNDPDLDFGPKSVTIRENNLKISYTYCQPEMLVEAPTKFDLKLDEVVSFKITAQDIQTLLKSITILGLPEIAIIGDGEDIYVAALNHKDESSNNFNINLGKTEKEFKFIFNKEMLKMIEKNYDVTLGENGVTQFKSEDGLVYIIRGDKI